jgi:hypothetical protein
MLVRAAVDIWYGSIVDKNVKKAISHVSRAWSNTRSSAEHASDEIQDMRHCPESVILLLRGPILDDLHPGFNIFQICMERRVRTGGPSPDVYLLLGGPVFGKVVWFLLQHEGQELEEYAAEGEYICFLSIVHT